jgi:mono/diheme cytochrome c family protein
MKLPFLSRCLLAALATAGGLEDTALAATPTALLNAYSAKAGAAPQPARGQQFFNMTHGREWSCASCHGAVPVQGGKHAATGKPIGAMAPAFNSDRFTDAAKTEKWFRRNCNDVAGRECTAAEKADVLGWLLTLKP